MSNQTPSQPTGWTAPPTAPPRKRHIGLIVGGIIVGFLIVGGIIGSLGSNDTTSSDTRATGIAAESSAPTNGISRGLGSADATGDIILVKGSLNGAYGIATAKLTITNHSAKRSDYFIEATLLDAAGDNIGTANAFASAVEPGQVAHAELTGSYTGKLDRAKITQVQRTAST